MTSKGILKTKPVDEHIRLDDDGNPVRVVDTRQRYGGFDAGASLAGMLAALGVTVLLGGVLGGIGTIGYQLDLERGTDQLSAGGLAGGLVTLLVAFLIGGWVAGRIGRYDGGRNGLMTAVWFILLAGALALLGAWLGDRYDVFGSLQVPHWFSDNATTTTAILTGVIAAVVMLGAGFVGGIVGARYHTRADAYLAAEQRDRITGTERIETVDATGHRHVTTGPALATEPASDRQIDRANEEIDLRNEEITARERLDDDAHEGARLEAERTADDDAAVDEVPDSRLQAIRDARAR